MSTAGQFELHPQLAADTYLVTDLELCRVLLMNDRRYPWLIAVPRVPGLSELDELTPRETSLYAEESRQLLAALRAIYAPDKLNVAALGNMVPQLHIHHIARMKTDDAWPRPVWGVLPALAYSEVESATALTRLRAELGA